MKQIITMTNFKTCFLNSDRVAIMEEVKLSTLQEAMVAARKEPHNWRAERPYNWRVDGSLDEVYPSIFVGDGAAAKNIDKLKELDISYVLNAAEGTSVGMVDTSWRFYKNTGIKYKGFTLVDLPFTDISAHFKDAGEFIDEALSSDNKILVHCLMGRSRSGSLVLAYLMMFCNMDIITAVKTVVKCRDIRPNSGFLTQLINLDKQLKKKSLKPESH